MMLYDLQRYAIEDKTGGALQLNLEARPLLLVLDMGLEQTALALVRGGKTFALEAKVILKIGAATFEEALAKWVQGCFAAQYPLLKKQKDVNFLPAAKRRYALLCQGVSQGEIEETIVIDSHPYAATLPMLRDGLTPIFRPLLGTDGSFMQSLRQFLRSNKQSAANLDRVICLGIFSRFPLLSEALVDAFKRPVLLPEMAQTVGWSAGVPESGRDEPQQNDSAKLSVTIIRSDPQREEREREESVVREQQEKEKATRQKKEEIKHQPFLLHRCNW